MIGNINKYCSNRSKKKEDLRARFPRRNKTEQRGSTQLADENSSRKYSIEVLLIPDQTSLIDVSFQPKTEPGSATFLVTP